MLADDPTDQFLRFSLAMELEKEGRHDESLARHDELTRDETPYVASYFMSAQQLARLGGPAMRVRSCAMASRRRGGRRIRTRPAK